MQFVFLHLISLLPCPAQSQSDATVSRRIEEEQKRSASLEKELSAMQKESAKWKNMCKAMEERLTAGVEGEDEGEGEGEGDDEELAMDEVEEEEVVEVIQPAKKEKGTTKKIDTSVPLRAEVPTVSAPRREKKDSAITKERKMPKSIRQDPPSKGKASSSKEKISGKKQKLRQ